MDKDLIIFISYILKRTVVTISDIEVETQSTHRQVMYRFQKLLTFLENEKLEPITLAEEKTLIIPDNTEKFLNEFITHGNYMHHYIFDSSERKQLIYLLNFINEEYLSLQHIMSLTRFSRNTTLVDIKELSKELLTYDIQLSYDRDNGYKLIGEELQIRSYMMHTVMDILSVHTNSNLLDHFIEKQGLDSYAQYQSIITMLSQENNIDFVDGRLKELIYILIFLKNRIKASNSLDAVEFKYDNIEIDMFLNFEEYKFVKHLVPIIFSDCRISIYEEVYLTSWILGVSQASFTQNSDDKLLIGKIVKEMLDRFKLLSGIKYHDYTKVFNSVYSHFRPAFYRILFKHPIYNPLTDRVQDKFQELFFLTKETLRPFMDQYSVEVSNEELAYLTIHFASMFNKEMLVAKHSFKAVIVCLHGLGSSNMLYHELTNMFSDLVFLPPLSRKDLHKIDEFKPDIIFSTNFFEELLEFQIPIVKVKPLMDMKERLEVTQDAQIKLGSYSFNKLTPQEILDIVEDHVGEIQDKSGLLLKLTQKLSADPNSSLSNTGNDLSLQDLISKNNISIIHEELDYEEVLKQTGAMLVSDGIITEQYIDKIIYNIKEDLTNYIVLPNVALPHTFATDGAIDYGLAISVLKTPCKFGLENETVKYVFFLSALEDNKHLKAMGELLELFSDELFFDIMDRAISGKEIYEYIFKKGDKDEKRRMHIENN